MLAFVLGAWLLQQQAALPDLRWLALLPLIILPVWALRRRSHVAATAARNICLLFFCAMLGFTWAAAFAAIRLSDGLPAGQEGKDIEVVGVVAAMPQIQERGERFLFDVEQVLTPHVHVPRHISLTRYFAGFRETSPPGAASQLHAGERWRITVRLKRPHGTANPFGFDFEAWALERDIRAVGYLRNGVQQRLAIFVPRPGYWIEYLRETVRVRMQRTLDGQPYAGVLQALAIGDESGIPREQWQVFLRTGIIHLMSISGLHVTMLASLAFALSYAIWRRIPRLVLRLPARKAAVLAGLAAAAGYALLAGYAVPTQRTLYMLAVVAAALWSGRVVAVSLVLCWALLVVVVLDPWALLAPGFWLSFGAVAAMMFAGGGRIASQGWLREAIHTQWAVTLGLTPLLLVLFQQVSLVSPLANAFAIPLVSLLVTPLTLLGAMLPLDGVLLAAHAVMAWCMAVLQPMSMLPAAVWQQHAPLPWTLPLALLGVFWLLLPRGFPARWAGSIALAPMFLMLPAVPSPGELRVAVLDVGQGLAVALRTAHHALLYDTGSRFSEDADSGNRIIVPYLRGTGVARLDGLIVSHDDNDHSGGAASVLDAVPVDWFVSSLPQHHPLLEHVPRHLRCFAGQGWEWDGVRFDMLHPAWASYENSAITDNDRSCVLRVTSAHGSLLLPADIERGSEAALLERSPDGLQADVLVVPHHGSKTSSTPEFLHAVAPRVAIFTVGYRNRFGHPKEEVLERYRALGGRLYRSDSDGAVLLDFTARGIGLTVWREARRRYWQTPAAGLAETGGTG